MQLYVLQICFIVEKKGIILYNFVQQLTSAHIYSPENSPHKALVVWLNLCGVHLRSLVTHSFSYDSTESVHICENISTSGYLPTQEYKETYTMCTTLYSHIFYTKNIPVFLREIHQKDTG